MYTCMYIRKQKQILVGLARKMHTVHIIPGEIVYTALQNLQILCMYTCIYIHMLYMHKCDLILENPPHMYLPGFREIQI